MPLVWSFVGSRVPAKVNRGFTLIELFITLSIAAILLTIGAPSFREMLVNNAVDSSGTTLITDLNLARTEAVKRGSAVVLCRSGNPTAATPACCAAVATGCSAETWSTGWLLYALPVGETAERSYNSGTDVLVRRREATDSVVIKSDGTAANWLVYAPDGSIRYEPSGTAAAFGLCYTTGPSAFHRLQISVGLNGRTNTADTTVCDPV